MNQQQYDREIRRFSCRPRCCEWCEKRGLKVKPLFPYLVERSDAEDGLPEEFRFWLHQECVQFLSMQPDVIGMTLVEPSTPLNQLPEYQDSRDEVDDLFDRSEWPPHKLQPPETGGKDARPNHTTPQ